MDRCLLVLPFSSPATAAAAVADFCFAMPGTRAARGLRCVVA